MYKNARNIFIDTNINYLPVVDADRNLVDVISKKRAFYRHYLAQGRFAYTHYAVCVWAATVEAVRLGVKAISVIEFGVAGGNGLLALEFHAKEISRLFGVEIQVYGFDTGEGLTDTSEDYRNLPYAFYTGQFQMDRSNLEARLESAKLIIGDIEQSGISFFEKCHPAPIGAMMVDVDIYTSTKSVLKMLDVDYKYLQPRIYTYFDDILSGTEGIGENLAIKEFNELNKGKMNIMPEGVGTDNLPYFTGLGLPNIPNRYQFRLLKTCHFFEHPLYKKFVSYKHELPLNKFYF